MCTIVAVIYSFNGNIYRKKIYATEVGLETIKSPKKTNTPKEQKQKQQKIKKASKTTKKKKKQQRKTHALTSRKG